MILKPILLNLLEKNFCLAYYSRHNEKTGITRLADHSVGFGSESEQVEALNIYCYILYSQQIDFGLFYELKR